MLLDTGEDPPTPPLPRSVSRWALADAARHSLLDHGVKASIRGCGTSRQGGEVSFRVFESHGQQRLAVDGVLWCSSGRCPRCGPVVGQKVSERVGAVLAAARVKGWGVALLTLTAAHSAQTRLEDAREDLTDAWRRLPDGGLGRRLKESGYQGMVRVWEATAGVSGWHLHVHALILHAGGTQAAIDAGMAVSSRWRGLMGARGYRTSDAAQDVRAVSGDCGLPDYGVKALTGWSAAAELASGWVKKGRRPDRVSIPQLLGLALHGDPWASARYAEAVDAMRGLRLMVVGPRLKKALGLEGDDPQDEAEQIELEVEAGQVIGTLPASVWSRAAVLSRRAWVAEQVWTRCILWGEVWDVVLPDIIRAIGPPLP